MNKIKLQPPKRSSPFVKAQGKRTSTWEKRLEEIQEEWRKHEVMNTCSICDSPEGHTEIKEFVREQKEKSVRELTENMELVGITVTINKKNYFPAIQKKDWNKLKKSLTK